MRTQLLPVVFLAFVPGMVHALGLGKLQLESALNEPMSARIELVAATAEELSSLNVDLADENAFARAGIPRHFILKQLRFSIKESEVGPDYILVTSDEPIREPFLNFLVEINWSKGRLYREYTVLLDPPIYVTEQGRKQITTVTTAKEPAPGKQEMATVTEEGHTVIYHPEYKPSTVPATTVTAPSETVPGRPVEYSGGDYGPVVSGDTLWSVARAMRPDSSVSIQQMMLALLRANPEAFINSNINGLKRGYVLKAPEVVDAQSLSKAEAFEEARMQNSLWEEARQVITEAPPVRAEGVPVQPALAVTEEPAPAVEVPEIAEEPAAPVTAETKPELRLVAPAEEGKSAGQGGVVEPGEEEVLTKELALATETLEALTQENTELKSKISESDAILSDLNRLITLKQDELAALQQQVAAKAAAKEATAPVTKAPAQEKPQPKQQVATAPATTKAKPKEEAKAPATKAMEEKAGSASIISSILGAITVWVEQIRKYYIFIAGALGTLLLVFLGTYFYRRRSEAAIEIPPGTFADLSEEPTIAAGSEDITDLNAPEPESEVITILPGQTAEKTQVAAPTAAGAAGESVVLTEGDPLEEVNVFLAYEHFDQAEEFVKNALEKAPDNLAYHSKLLEVYYTANNKKAYEDAARVLYDKTQGKGDYWNMALAMWQVLSPKRALFAAPAAGEEPAAEPVAAKEGGGIVNIAGEGEATTGTGSLDLDLDTTGGGADTGGDTLEVEAAEAEPDVLDVTAAISTADSEVLDVTSAVDTGATGRAEEEVVIATAADEEGALDFSLDLEEEKEPEAEESLESSLDLLQPSEETTASPAKNLDEEDLEFSLELDEPEEKVEEAGELELDMSLDYAAEPVLEESLTGSALLDVTSSVASSVEEAELSKTGAGLLDVTSARSIDNGETGAAEEIVGDAGEGLMDMSMPGPAKGADMLDVTAATDFDLETGQDLLDLTSAGTPAGTEEVDDSMLDFELSPDKPAPGADAAMVFEGIDLTVGTGVPGAGLELELESSPESAEEEFAMDMDATMQIPTKRSTLSGAAKEDETLRVPSTSGGAQSEEDEIATQLDLAKAYIELGNAESAKTILGEIIVAGNAEQRQQAQELLGQLA